jgi:multiple sugar transport system ATP-binding protein
MARVVLEDLVKVYPQKNAPDVRAVRGINLTVEDREFMVLVGPSGCGKSTTLRMVAGLEEISSGRILIGDQVVNEVAPKDRDIAMVFQNYALYPHLSVYENLAFSLKLRRLPKPEIDRRVREAAALLGLEACLGRRPRALSGGQRQRVAVGRAMVRQPKVFLFDEPLSNLDAQMRVTMRTELSKLHARLGATMIYVTHDQMEAMSMGDRICVLKDGDIQQVDTPLAIYHRPANLFVAGFIGSPPMNFFRGSILPAGGEQVFVTDHVGEALPVTLPLTDALLGRARHRLGQPLVLGIRPEDVRVGRGTPAGRALDAEIEVAEPMGAETYLYLRASQLPCVARVRSDESYLPGQRVRLSLDLDRVHLFDAETERAL